MSVNVGTSAAHAAPAGREGLSHRSMAQRVPVSSWVPCPGSRQAHDWGLQQPVWPWNNRALLPRLGNTIPSWLVCWLAQTALTFLWHLLCLHIALW